jgi:hypothetical protein
MSWVSSILEILKSLFRYLSKKTLTEEEKIARIKTEEKQQVKNDWKSTQDEIDRAFEFAKSRQRVQDDKNRSNINS